nr:hypothetical protein CFP56_19308 [Quercus suber]
MYFVSLRRLKLIAGNLLFFCPQWPSLLLCYTMCCLGTLIIMLLSRHNLVVSMTPVNAQGRNHDDHDTQLWQSARFPNESLYLLEALQDTLGTTQSVKFWNGSYWPSTIQWVGAVMNTIVVASAQSFADVLDDSDYGVRKSKNLSLELDQDIRRYWNDVEAYYDAEDTLQIFGAAYDDAQWVVLEWLEAIKFVRHNNYYANSTLREHIIAKMAHRAHIFYNIVQNEFNTSYCQGGITWNPSLAPYKNAITNELFLSSSIAMYLYHPGDNNTDPYLSTHRKSRRTDKGLDMKPIQESRRYKMYNNTTLPFLRPIRAQDPVFLANAKKEWAWFQSQNFTSAQGLIVDGFHVSANQSTCDERNEMVYTYNQGVLLSGLRGLWEASGDVTYLSEGYKIINTTIRATGWFVVNVSEAAQWAGLGRNGIMEDYCDAPATCSQDAQIFKGIYFQHLDQFCEPLPTSTPLIANVTHTASTLLALQHEQNCQSYMPWIRHNAHAALHTRNASNIIGGWWGASQLNKTQRPVPQLAQPLPAGSWDVHNVPTMLELAPWPCRLGRHGCSRQISGDEHSYPHHENQIAMSRRKFMKSTLHSRNQTGDRNDDGRGRTVETQASGLGVVKAAVNFHLRWDRTHL